MRIRSLPGASSIDHYKETLKSGMACFPYVTYVDSHSTHGSNEIHLSVPAECHRHFNHILLSNFLWKNVRRSIRPQMKLQVFCSVTPFFLVSPLQLHLNSVATHTRYHSNSLFLSVILGN